MQLMNDGRDARAALFGEIDAHATTSIPPGQAHGASPVCKTKNPLECLERFPIERNRSIDQNSLKRKNASAWRLAGSMRGEQGASAA
jgi:hypothetical protein